MKNAIVDKPRKGAKKYLDSKQLWEELKKTRESGQPTEELGRLFILMHLNILKHKNFCNYPRELKEDMCSYSYFRLFKRGIYSFDLSQGEKAFSYFTMAIFNNFYTYLGRHYKQLNKRQELVKKMLEQLPPEHRSAALERLTGSFQSSLDSMSGE